MTRAQGALSSDGVVGEVVFNEMADEFILV